MNLQKFVDQHLDHTPVPTLAVLGPISARVHSKLNDHERAWSLIATTFWQAFIA